MKTKSTAVVLNSFLLDIFILISNFIPFPTFLSIRQLSPPPPLFWTLDSKGSCSNFQLDRAMNAVVSKFLMQLLGFTLSALQSMLLFSYIAFYLFFLSWYFQVLNLEVTIHLISLTGLSYVLLVQKYFFIIQLSIADLAPLRAAILWMHHINFEWVNKSVWYHRHRNIREIKIPKTCLIDSWPQLPIPNHAVCFLSILSILIECQSLCSDFPQQWISNDQ